MSASETPAPGAISQSISVRSYVRANGKRAILVTPYCPAKHEERLLHLKSLEARGIIEDWQASHHADVAEARSCIMRMYGIGWFNMARAQLSAIAQVSA